MDSVIHILVHGLYALNKIACVGVILGVVWFLQRYSVDEEAEEKYPEIKSLPFRVFVALIGAGFAIDLFSVYRPDLSEVVMNLGFLGASVQLYLSYNKGKSKEKNFVNKTKVR